MCVWKVTIFCEGTRFTPEKHAESMKVAKEKGFPELKYHLLPRTKGFFLAASLIEGKSNNTNLTHNYPEIRI